MKSMNSMNSMNLMNSMNSMHLLRATILFVASSLVVNLFVGSPGRFVTSMNSFSPMNLSSSLREAILHVEGPPFGNSVCEECRVAQ